MGKGVLVSLQCGVDRVTHAFGYVAGVILLAMAAITGYEVVARYVFNAPTIWSVDLGIFLLIWFAYTSMAYVQKAGRHVRVDLVTSRFPPRTREIWEVVCLALFLGFVALLFYSGIKVTIHMFRTQEYGWMLWRVVLWPVRLAIPVGGGILLLLLIKDLVVKIHDVLTKRLEPGTGIFARPAIMVPVFLALIAGSVFLMTINGIAGVALLILVLLFGGVPIFPALGLVGVAGTYLMYGGLSGVLNSLPRTAFSSLDSFSLVCLPLFVLVGQVLADAGVGEEIFDFASEWVGAFPGGESIATIVACAIFAAISASSVATAATIGLVALPALARRRYNKRFSYGLLAAGGTLGIMIPPSATMIIYSSVTEESLGKLFLAGVIPGIILATAFICYAYYFCTRTGEYERRGAPSWREKLGALRNGAWGLAAPLIIIGGIYSGLFTPLESGAMAVLYAILMSLGRRKLKPQQLPKTLAESSLAGTMVLSIIVGAIILGNLVTLMRVPNMVMDFVSGLGVSRWWIMAAIMLLYIVLGMFLEVISCMLITLPIMYPLIISLGFDGIWFAVMVTLNMEMALVTPPVGLNLYTITGIAKARIADVLRGVVPFFIIMVLGMILYASFPILSTWLPGVMVAR